MFACVALRVSLTSDLARCFGRFAGTRGRRRYRSRFSLYKSCSVRRRRRFSFSSISHSRSSCSRFSRSLFLGSAYPSSFSCSCCFVLSSLSLLRFRFPFVVFVVRERLSKGNIVFVRVSVFVRLLAFCDITFVGPFGDRIICSVFRVRSSRFV